MFSLQHGFIEHASWIRVRYWEGKPNVEFVRRHRDGRLMRIILSSHGADFSRPGSRGNPQNTVHNHETPRTNPPRVWEHKRRKKPEFTDDEDED